MIVISFICVISFIAGLLILFGKSLPSKGRILLFVLCSIVFVISAFLNVVMLDGRRIGKGADEFLDNVIQNARNNQCPAISKIRTSKEKDDICEIVDALPKCNYKVQYKDYFFGVWEYKVYFDNGETYFVDIDAPGTFMKLFAKPEHSLSNIKKIENSAESPKVN